MNDKTLLKDNSISDLSHECKFISCGSVHAQCTKCGRARNFRQTLKHPGGDWCYAITFNKRLRVISLAMSIAKHVGGNYLKNSCPDSHISINGKGGYCVESIFNFSCFLIEYLIYLKGHPPIIMVKGKPKVNYEKLVEVYIKNKYRTLLPLIYKRVNYKVDIKKLEENFGINIINFSNLDDLLGKIYDKTILKK